MAAMEKLTSCIDSISLQNYRDDVKTTKQNQRLKIWKYMEQNYLLKNYPLSCIGKIPNFKKCDIAAKKVSRLKEFRNANYIKINPSLAQMHLRYLTLYHGKTLLVPNPALTEDFMYEVNPANLKKPWLLKRASSKAGSKEYGRKLKLTSKIKIDLFVVASVACCRNGVRIGKGMGFAEIEWGILYEMGAVNNDTVVVTTVHDRQLATEKELPLSLVCPYDLPVDIIVTPTKIINIWNRLQKPCVGIDWSLLTAERLNEMPVLQSLREKFCMLRGKYPCMIER